MIDLSQRILRGKKCVYLIAMGRNYFWRSCCFTPTATGKDYAVGIVTLGAFGLKAFCLVNISKYMIFLELSTSNKWSFNKPFGISAKNKIKKHLETLLSFEWKLLREKKARVCLIDGGVDVNSEIRWWSDGGGLVNIKCAFCKVFLRWWSCKY